MFFKKQMTLDKIKIKIRRDDGNMGDSAAGGGRNMG